MKDRYLFRGKRKDTGEWMIGSLICFPDDDKHYGIWSENAQTYIWVNPATVGQCTGLKDKDGMLIHEGDVIQCEVSIFDKDTEEKIKLMLTAIIFWDNHQWSCSDVRGVFMDSYQPLFNKEMFSTVKIIGNIHDNPELREVR